VPDEEPLTCVDLFAGARGLAWAFTGLGSALSRLLRRTSGRQLHLLATSLRATVVVADIRQVTNRIWSVSGLAEPCAHWRSALPAIFAQQRQQQRPQGST